MAIDQFHRYEIKTELASSQMATVYRAYDPLFGRDVALKVLPRQYLHDPTFRASFKREARVIASLEHRAIVPVYDFGEQEQQLYLVMRFMPGGSLADRLKDGPLSVAEAARILTHLAPALDEAHARGIIHRNLKPGHILFDQQDHPYISNFRIAKLARGPQRGDNAIIGTSDYMSPEQLHGDKALDGRSDIYVLGIILFEMLTGRTPDEDEAGLPRECRPVIAKAMAKEPHARYPTARALATALQEVVDRQNVSSKQKRSVALPSPILAASLLLVILLLVGGLISWRFFGNDVKENPAVAVNTSPTTILESTATDEEAATTNLTATPTARATSTPVNTESGSNSNPLMTSTPVSTFTPIPSNTPVPETSQIIPASATNSSESNSEESDGSTSPAPESAPPPPSSPVQDAPPNNNPPNGSATPVLPTETSVPPTVTTVGQPDTPVPSATERSVPPTVTTVGQPDTPVPSATERSVPPTGTTVPPTDTPVPSLTDAAVPPTVTTVGRIGAIVSPTATSAPPTATSVPPTATSFTPTTTAAQEAALEAAISFAETAQAVSPTATPAPPTATSAPPTSVPPTATSAPPTATFVPPTATFVPPTATFVPPTATPVPPTATPVPPTATPVPPTATFVPPTATFVPPTATFVPPTATFVPPTATFVPPTATYVPPTATPVPPTATYVPPTATFVPPTATLVPPTPTPRNVTVTLLSPNPDERKKIHTVRFKVEVSGKLDSDRLQLRIGIDQQQLFEEDHLVWNPESSDVYFTEMNYQPNNLGFGKDYYWTVAIIAADGTVYGLPPERKFRWDEPGSGSGSGQGGSPGNSTSP